MQTYGYFYVDMSRIHSQVMVFYAGEQHCEPHEPESLFYYISPIKMRFDKNEASGAVEDALVMLFVETMHKLQQPEYKGTAKRYVVAVELKTELLDRILVGHVYRLLP